MNENRLVDIEIKIAHQEDVVDSLNQVVYQQQKKMDHLEAMILALAKHIKEMSGAGSMVDAGNEKPPHY